MNYEIDILFLFLIGMQWVFIFWQIQARIMKEYGAQILAGLMVVIFWSFSFLSPFCRFAHKELWFIVICTNFAGAIYLICDALISYVRMKFKM